ncbi:MAG: efflux RND transporter periplasmic adaptor subunit [Flavobacteriaceae bacterium]|nr:efflux RND transporter periplasmic adaptor subunit [Flavobacteriaceae bacterium]
MKKYIVYIGVLAIGLLLGWFLFGNSSNEVDHNHNEVTEANQMWTCSMHPQIMQSEPGDCPICGMDLIPVDSGMDDLSPDQFQLTENALALANIQTSVVGFDSSDNGVVRLSGKIVENEEANVVQVTYFSGRIERLYVNSTGEQVRKGQLLASIYSPELFAAQQELLTASSIKESQPELYKAVRNKLKLWKISEKQIDQIETSGEIKENFPVYANVSGTVSEKLIEQGESVSSGQPILKIADLSTVWANFDIYESQIDQFKTGQEIIVTTNAYKSKSFNSKVDFIDPVLNSKTRTVTLRTVLRNPEGEFKPGMFVEGTIQLMTDNGNKVVRVPSSAVMWTGKRSVVYVKTDPQSPIFEMREVTLGNKLGDYYEVVEGLKTGEEIVTNGTFTIDAAAQLQGKKSMMNKSGDKTMSGHDDHNGMTEKNGSDPDKTTTKMEFSDAFQSTFKPVITSYLKLKDALVESDLEQTAVFAKETLIVLKKVDQNDLKAMERSHLTKSIDMLDAIAKSDKLEDQRAFFVTLNENMVAIANNLIALENALYVQFCPMANDNKGAIWISADKEIRNPYYGDAMLKCGSVKSIID